MYYTGYMEHRKGWSEKYAKNLLRLSEAEGVVELKTEREHVIWTRAQDDAREFLREMALQQGYAVREVRMPPVTPTPTEELEFYQRTWTEMGPFTWHEDALYLRSFRNTCLEGYPHKDS